MHKATIYYDFGDDDHMVLVVCDVVGQPMQV
jgi:hypothetical protein